MCVCIYVKERDSKRTVIYFVCSPFFLCPSLYIYLSTSTFPLFLSLSLSLPLNIYMCVYLWGVSERDRDKQT